MRDKDLLKFFLQNGWKLDRINGSHHILKKDDKTEIIPVHGRDIPKGLLNAILKRNGFKSRRGVCIIFIQLYFIKMKRSIGLNSLTWRDAKPMKIPWKNALWQPPKHWKDTSYH